MKKYSLPYFIFILLAGPFFSGCIDSSDKPIAPATTDNNSELLTTAPWKLSAFTVDPAVDVNNDGTPETDLYPIAAPDSCTKDDITVFKTDQTYTREEGATKCDTTADQVFESGSWAFSENAKKLTLTKSLDSSSTILDIIILSPTTLKLSYKEDLNGVNYTFTQTLSH